MKTQSTSSLIPTFEKIVIVILISLPLVLNQKSISTFNCSSSSDSEEWQENCALCLSLCTSIDLSCIETVCNFTSKSSFNRSEIWNEEIENQVYILSKFFRTPIWSICAYIVIFVFGVIGNVAVIYVVYKCRRMRTTTNILVSHLAFADLLVVVFCLPFQLFNNLYLEWKFGEFFCKLVPYLQGVSVCASIFILMAISVERCLTICHPMLHHSKNKIPAYVIIFIWVIPMILPMPWFFYFEVEPLDDNNNIQVCVESWPTVDIGNIYFLAVNVLLCYLFPLSVISVCFYCIWRRVSTRIPPGENVVQCNAIIHRSKIKVTKMILIVIILFTCSWLPCYIIYLLLKFSEPPKFVFSLIPYAQGLGVSNSCVNPILYTFYNKNFRNTFKALFSNKTCCKHGKTFQSFTSSRTRTDILSNQGIYREKIKKLDIISVKVGKENRQIKRTMSSQIPAKSCISAKVGLLRGQSLDYI